jgi:hypothetical protein
LFEPAQGALISGGKNPLDRNAKGQRNERRHVFMCHAGSFCFNGAGIHLSIGWTCIIDFCAPFFHFWRALNYDKLLQTFWRKSYIDEVVSVNIERTQLESRRLQK